MRGDAANPFFSISQLRRALILTQSERLSHSESSGAHYDTILHSGLIVSPPLEK
jgi:hypothetical protein